MICKIIANATQNFEFWILDDELLAVLPDRIFDLRFLNFRFLAGSQN